MRPALLLLLSLPLQAQSPDLKQEPKPTPTIAAKTTGMTHLPGLIPLDWDPKAGHLYLELPAAPHDFLYTHSLPYGTGSNDLGLDRGQVSEGRIVHFERTGPKVLLVQPNQAFRGSTKDPAELLSIHQSFPESILAGFTIAAEDPAANGNSGTILVDATDFFLRDAHGVTETLTQLKQGSYKLDPTRSTIARDATKAFPKNTEVEAVLTFTTDSAPTRHSFVADVTPDPHALTLREHQSFLELPPPGFTPRRFDPRAGYFPTSYRDYSAPLGADLDQQFIVRHRLIKKDPTCTHACEPVAPIQYYVDSGAPEPIRSALVEGARWWDQAFQAAGWAKGTFRVDPLPPGADPMDIRYNIIQWVHRYTRGWSYGEAVTDPRTGEIIKGNVTLGSLRGRQDYLIAEALLSPYVTGNKPLPSENDPMLQMVLQRIRQLSAHETGHTLGLAHNFAASAFPHTNPDETISVMDYPHPYITLNKEGIPDLSHAYPVNIGSLGQVAIDYGYREFPATTNQHEALDKILTDSQNPASSTSPTKTPAPSPAPTPTPTSGTTAPTPQPNSTASSPSARPPSPASEPTPLSPALPWRSLKTPSSPCICSTATRPKPPSRRSPALTTATTCEATPRSTRGSSPPKTSRRPSPPSSKPSPPKPSPSPSPSSPSSRHSPPASSAPASPSPQRPASPSTPSPPPSPPPTSPCRSSSTPPAPPASSSTTPATRPSQPSNSSSIRPSPHPWPPTPPASPRSSPAPSSIASSSPSSPSPPTPPPPASPAPSSASASSNSNPPPPQT